MSKKNLKPKQQQPVIRQTAHAAIMGAAENSTQGWMDGNSGVIPLYETYCDMETRVCSYGGDDAE